MSSPAHASTLALARQHAEAGRFTPFLALCRELRDASPEVSVQLDTGALLAAYGFLSDARLCYENSLSADPTDLRAKVNLANVARDAGQHGEARRLYAELLERLPNHPVIRRNALSSVEYDPAVSDPERVTQAKAWGSWAIQRAGGHRPRPARHPLAQRPLRLGYVSPDLCQHTVGLFVKEVLKAHDRGRVEVLAYSAGQQKDWVSAEIAAACTVREASTLDDTALAEQIRADGIDLLIDLSGHTAGSRLTVFAHRPAAVMVSWLGYFATTGLPTLDAVLLDPWHAPPETDHQFVEPIIRLPQRLCYSPVPFAPAVAAAPFLRNGHFTFGSFNNSAKYNPAVFDLWASILRAVPRSRLILKWRTFNDEAFRHEVVRLFGDRGVEPDRIELRGPSFHAELLKEYADIDIALDPFPFTGGLTTCEALWMGVPVITWPQTRVVSRQSFAFLNAIGLTELVAKDADDYQRIALALANKPERLLELRTTLRSRMQASALCDVPGFTRSLEDTLIGLSRDLGPDRPNR